MHTGAWPEDLDLTGKRVGVIGNGSTGNQVITATAPIAEHLTSFQRTPQYSVPAGNRELSPEQLQAHRDNFDATWDQVRNSSVAMGFEESTIETFSVSAEERERIFQDAWDDGGGFRFMFETFCDIATDEAANEEAASSSAARSPRSSRIPRPRRKLTPTDLYARRPLCDSGFYETFNRPNVSTGQREGNPDHHVTEKGIVTADGTLHELDVLVCATGFDAVDGNYMRVDIRAATGRRCAALERRTDQLPRRGDHRVPQHVHDPRPQRTVHEPAAHDRGPGRMDRRQLSATVAAGDAGWIDVKPEIETAWTETCSDIAHQTLFPRAASWIFGANIPGKKRTVMFYLGGMKEYRLHQRCRNRRGVSGIPVQRRRACRRVSTDG